MDKQINDLQQLKKQQDYLDTLLKRKIEYEKKLKELNIKIKNAQDKVFACEKGIRLDIISELLGPDLGIEELFALRDVKEEINSVVSKIIKRPEETTPEETTPEETTPEETSQQIHHHIAGGVK